jgi:hypothetical protein
MAKQQKTVRLSEPVLEILAKVRDCIDQESYARAIEYLAWYWKHDNPELFTDNSSRVPK